MAPRCVQCPICVVSYANLSQHSQQSLGHKMENKEEAELLEKYTRKAKEVYVLRSLASLRVSNPILLMVSTLDRSFQPLSEWRKRDKAGSSMGALKEPPVLNDKEQVQVPQEEQPSTSKESSSASQIGECSNPSCIEMARKLKGEPPQGVHDVLCGSEREGQMPGEGCDGPQPHSAVHCLRGKGTVPEGKFCFPQGSHLHNKICVPPQTC
ncbi:uncharacterized protein LOC143526182 [Brachyhypopomus gauderio]|uniref:uncharacterized protein LOC143526182 n=1 Tax=Brachyhypopomus gauderio TaxID=698409 RepID=UPI00404339AC